MILPRKVPLFALVTTLSACGAGRTVPPEPIPVLAEQRICPKPPLPPAELLRRPVRKDFLPSLRTNGG